MTLLKMTVAGGLFSWLARSRLGRIIFATVAYAFAISSPLLRSAASLSGVASALALFHARMMVLILLTASSFSFFAVNVINNGLPWEKAFYGTDRRSLGGLVQLAWVSVCDISGLLRIKTSICASARAQH